MPKEKTNELNTTAIAELALKRWGDDAGNREVRTNRYLANFTHMYLEQWSSTEAEAVKGRPKISFFLSADTIRQYRAKLFPGRAEIGIKVYDDKNNTIQNAQTDEATNTDTAKYEQYILDTYEQNQMPLVLKEQAEWFFVGGEACIFAPHDPKKAPGQDADAFIYSINPCNVTIGIFGNQKVFGMHEQTITAQQARKLSWVKLDSNIADDAILSDIYYFDLYYYARIINQEVTSSKCLKNPYVSGYEIPYFWIPNNNKPGATNGNSELRHLKVIEKELNFRVSDYAERLKRGVIGPVFVSGAGNNKNISLAHDMVNYLGPGGKAERLALAGDGQDYLNYFEFILQLYQKKTTITDEITGTKNATSAASGIALQYKFLSLQELIDEKRLIWDNGLKQLNKTILYYKFGPKHKFRNKPIYATSLPTDETAAARNNALLVEAGLKAREAAIDDLNPNESAQDIVKKIDQDQKAHPEFYKKPNQPNDNLNPTPKTKIVW